MKITENEKLAKKIYKESHSLPKIFSMENGGDIINHSIMKAILRMAEEKDKEHHTNRNCPDCRRILEVRDNKITELEAEIQNLSGGGKEGKI